MLTARIFDAVTALERNVLLAAFSRTGTVKGSAPADPLTLTDSTIALDIDIPARDIQIDGAKISAAAATVTLEPNESAWPREDVIWTDGNGDVQVRKGDPAPYNPTRDTDGDFDNDRPARQTYSPQRDDMADVLRTTPPTGVVEATVAVPPHTDAAADLTDDDWQDFRIATPYTAGSQSHDDLTDVQAGQHRTDSNVQTTVDGSDIDIAGNAATATDADAVDGYDVQKDGTDGTGVINFKTQ